jgi:two-component system phosphate regulon response regulator PhoB
MKTRAKILVVDDHPDLLDVLEMNLSREGFEVETAQTGSKALDYLSQDMVDLILLDVMLEDTTGIKLAGKLKKDPRTASIPIIMLTAKDTETDMVVGLSVGADDYITKPFSTQVLLARIEALLRRVYPEEKDTAKSVTVGPFRMIPAGRQLFVDGKPVELTSSEYNIMLAILQGRGEVLTREQLKQALWPESADRKERIVDVHVASLRKKLGNFRKHIRTVHGRGYRVMA